MSKPSASAVFDNLVLPPKTEQSLQVLATGIIRRQENNAPLRNILVYGPPGTGKTLFAQNLALMCGMDYALFTGGDVGACGR
jgi:ATPase family AAA domain-containing protein 3A/B